MGIDLADRGLAAAGEAVERLLAARVTLPAALAVLLAAALAPVDPYLAGLPGASVPAVARLLQTGAAVGSFWVGYRSVRLRRRRAAGATPTDAAGEVAVEADDGPAIHGDVHGDVIYRPVREEADGAAREPDHFGDEVVSALFDAGCDLYRAGEVDAAARAYEGVLDAAPGHHRAHTNYGVLLAERGRPDEAEAQFRRALDAHPGSALAHTRYALLLAEDGRLAEADEQFERAVAGAESLPPGQRATLHRRYADLLDALDRPAEAEAQRAAAEGLAA